MTNLDAIKAKLNYPLPDNSYITALLGRGLISTDVYSDFRSLELAQADLMYTLITTPAITEGGFSISLSNKEAVRSAANGIYARYGVRNPYEKKPTAKFVQKW
jgi:hypothetical protein